MQRYYVRHNKGRGDSNIPKKIFFVYKKKWGVPIQNLLIIREIKLLKWEIHTEQYCKDNI